MTNLNSWVNSLYNTELESKNNITLRPLTNDASFRKYYRFDFNRKSYIAVDSPPDREKNKEFLAIQSILFSNQVTVPEIIFTNLDKGYFIIEDFGDDILLPYLKQNLKQNFKNIQTKYQFCIDQLIKIQSININKSNYELPYFNQDLLSYEFELFTDWFLNKYLNISLSPEQDHNLKNIFKIISKSFLEQPQVLVHRDYHSRNLICLTKNKIEQVGVIDFQDALIGPVSYDLVSLYRDCYISWPIKDVKDWAQSYFKQAQDCSILKQELSFDQFWLWFLQTSLQRNFKAIGIFCRLYLRDNKPVYLGDIPRTLDYAIEASFILSNYNKDYINLNKFLENKIKPMVLDLALTLTLTAEQLIN